MSFKKKMLAVAAVSALTVATAVPAMALENEFHGMYKFMGYQSNFFNGASAGLFADSHGGFFAEQRARINYIAKANDNLKLVTNFELDTRFGGKSGGYLGTTGNDGGNLDADQLTLETKSVYVDFNCPITGSNVKVGMQPWADSYQSLFLLADMTGAIATRKFDPLTLSLGWFRFDDNTTTSALGAGQLTADLIVADAKFAITKDIIVGASYYNVQNDTGPNVAATPATADLITGVVTPAVAAVTTATNYELLHMIGLNADIKFGPVAIKPFVAYQFGDALPTPVTLAKNDISAFLAGATAKIKVGPGSVNAATIYLSGDDDGLGDNDDFKALTAGTSYFNASNMWLLVRSGQAINSSTSVLGNDLSVGGRGLIGLFAGYEGAIDKVFFNANIGYAMTAEERGTEDGVLGTEINAQIGYKMFDNMSISAAAAYALLGDGLSASAASGKKIAGFGANDADDPYMFNVQLSYAF